MSLTSFSSTTLDKIAVLLSGVCIVHCLVTPLLVTLLPIIALSALAEDILFHRLMLWLVLPTSCIALYIGCHKHRDLKIVATGVIGMLMLVAIAFFGHDVFTGWGEKSPLQSPGWCWQARIFLITALAATPYVTTKTVAKHTITKPRCPTWPTAI